MKLGMRLATGATALGLSIGSAALVAAAQMTVSLAGESYGAFVSTPSASLPKAASAVLPGSGMADAHLPSVSVPGVLRVGSLSSITTGDGVAGDASTQSIASLEEIDVLGGLITAEGVVAMSTSYLGGSGGVSEAEGTSFTNLVVAGVAIDTEVAPNTRINLPGVGYVVLNEQLFEGNGSTSTGLRVNGIHVVLQAPMVGTKIGDIIVASAHSAAAQ